MSIVALKNSSSSCSSSMQRSVFMQPCRGLSAGRGRLPMAEKREAEKEEEGSCSPSSSIGTNSDEESAEDCKETEVESSCQGPLDTMDALEEVPPVSQEEFKQFHLIDRKLYTLLVIQLLRDPIESMQVMAFWIWLEKLGVTNVVKNILSSPCVVINEIAKESCLFLKCVNHDQFHFSRDNSDFTLNQSLRARELCLTLCLDGMAGVRSGVAKILRDICPRIFSDIMEAAIELNASQSFLDKQAMVGDQQQYIPEMFPQTGNYLNLLGSHAIILRMLLQPACGHNVFEHPLAGYGYNIFGSQETVLDQMEAPQPQHQHLSQEDQVPAEERTMFFTFSKGYYVWEWEVREFLAENFGDCIESLHMQDVAPNEQILYARVVFRTVDTMLLILNGNEKVKFTINGKHVWARKFVSKRLGPSSYPPNVPPFYGP